MIHFYLLMQLYIINAVTYVALLTCLCDYIHNNNNKNNNDKLFLL